MISKCCFFQIKCVEGSNNLGYITKCIDLNFHKRGTITTHPGLLTNTSLCPFPIHEVIPNLECKTKSTNTFYRTLYHSVSYRQTLWYGRKCIKCFGENVIPISYIGRVAL